MYKFNTSLILNINQLDHRIVTTINYNLEEFNVHNITIELNPKFGYSYNVKFSSKLKLISKDISLISRALTFNHFCYKTRKTIKIKCNNIIEI